MALLAYFDTSLLDATHLATALVHNADMFLTNDKQLARAALETGLQVWPD